MHKMLLLYNAGQKLNRICMEVHIVCATATDAVVSSISIVQCYLHLNNSDLTMKVTEYS